MYCTVLLKKKFLVFHIKLLLTLPSPVSKKGPCQSIKNNSLCRILLLYDLFNQDFRLLRKHFPLNETT